MPPRRQPGSELAAVAADPDRLRGVVESINENAHGSGSEDIGLGVEGRLNSAGGVVALWAVLLSAPQRGTSSHGLVASQPIAA
jgi:hypothetical protein